MNTNMNAEETIIANAEHHTRLLSTISGLEYVPAAVQQQGAYIADLEAQLRAGNARIGAFAEKTAKERREHEALRNATGKRLAHKLLGKREEFEARASKEEREYVEALEKEMTERGVYTATERLLEDARNELQNLKDKNTLYESAQAELQALYQRVFDGPSESFPEDDRLEYDLNEAIREHERILQKMNAESRAAEVLARAVREMDACQKSMQEALGYSRYDMWGGGTMTDILERNALTAAQRQASQVEVLVEQAMKISPAVQPVGRVNIASGSIVSDVFFDNFFTDLNFHNKIRQSAAQVLLANQRLKVEQDAARRRAESMGSQLNRSAETLDRCRRELDNFRRATFESYAAQHPPPPSYDAIANEPKPPAISSPPPPPPADPEPISRSAGPLPYVLSTPSGGAGASPVAPDELAPEPIGWGSRNPYASAIFEQTRKLSSD